MKISDSGKSNVSESVLQDCIEVTYTNEIGTEQCRLLPRPGAADLLVQLMKYTSPMIYSSEDERFIEEAMLQLSIVQGNPDECTDEEYERGEAFFGHYVWSRDQCIKEPEGYVKSLGTLSEFSDNGINDIWLIDHKPELVDLPSHVIQVSEFKGDPNDTELYRVIDQIFCN